jgi:peptide/nickel transport system permease protein
MLIRVVAAHIGRLILTVLLVGLIGATLVRMAPAYGVSENELDARYGKPAIAAMRAERAREPGVLQFYAGYLASLARGDLGWSPSLNRPVCELIRQRLPLSLAVLAAGVAASVGFGIAAAVVAMRFRFLSIAPTFVASMSLSLPSGVVALLLLLAGASEYWALALVLFPYSYRYTRDLLAAAENAPHVVAARARGVRPVRLVLVHMLRVLAPQLAAVVGLVVSIGFPALVPIEVVSDAPGVLQLAWKAALARDLPVLVTVTMIAAVVVMLGNAASDVLAHSMRRAA